MSNLAERQPQSSPRPATRGATDDVFLGTGTVVSIEGDSIVVRLGENDVPAARATSCLIAPMPGDRVLVAMPEGECFVLAVLQREAGAACKLAVEGDLEIASRKGKVAVASPGGIDMLTSGEARVTAARLALHAPEADAVIDKLSFLGSVLRAELVKLRVVAEQCDSLFERAVQRVKSSYRFVAEIDQVRAKQVDMVAKDAVRVHAGNAVVTAEELVKIDGEQVHIG